MDPIIIKLDKFIPRPYQLSLIDAIENKGYKKALCIWPRRAGKDLTVFWICIRALLMKVQVIFYCFPNFAQGRRVLWDSITTDGMRILDMIPPEVIESRNEAMMRIKFNNGSMLSVIGSDTYDTSMIGTNPSGIVFSEWALQDNRAYMYSRPILAANNGWAIFISTPRGKNHMWDMYQYAKDAPEWFVQKLTVEDTKHISPEVIDQERREMSEDLIMQEFYTSFTMGVEGAYYSKYLDKLKLNNQVGIVPWDSSLQVHSAWDLGVRDNTCIIWFQVTNTLVKIIDCYSNSKDGLEHYIGVINSKPYIYGKHIAPFDIKVQEFGSGITRWEKARQLGIKFTVSNDAGIEDGIEAVRTLLPRCYFDEVKCAPLLKALENYRQEYDHVKKVYQSRPLHNWSSHFADAMRYLAVSVPKTKQSMDSEDFDKLKGEAMYGNKSNLPRIFQ